MELPIDYLPKTFYFYKKKIMAKKLKWTETFTTTSWYEAVLTDEEAKLFEEDEQRFYEEVDFNSNAELINDKIFNDTSEDFELVDE